MRETVLMDVVHVGIAASLFILFIKFVTAKLAGMGLFPKGAANVVGML